MQKYGQLLVARQLTSFGSGREREHCGRITARSVDEDQERRDIGFAELDRDVELELVGEDVDAAG